MWFRDFKKSKPARFALRALIGPAFSFSAARVPRERPGSAQADIPQQIDPRSGEARDAE